MRRFAKSEVFQRLFWLLAAGLSVLGVAWGLALALRVPQPHDGIGFKRFADGSYPTWFSQAQGLFFVIVFAVLGLISLRQLVIGRDEPTPIRNPIHVLRAYWKRPRALELLKRLFMPAAAIFSLLGVLLGISVVLGFPYRHDERHYHAPVASYGPDDARFAWGSAIIVVFGAIFVVCAYQVVTREPGRRGTAAIADPLIELRKALEGHTSQQAKITRLAIDAFVASGPPPNQIVYDETTGWDDVNECNAYCRSTEPIDIALDPELWKRRDWVSLFSDEGLAYYLPLLIINGLMVDSEYELWDSLIYTLDSKLKRTELRALVSPALREVILAFARFAAEDCPEYVHQVQRIEALLDF